MNFKRKSLSRQLLVSILGIYVLITFVVTVAHVVIEYTYTKDNIKNELSSIAHIFAPALKTAVWNLNDEQVQSIADGMNMMPLIYGVTIIDPNNQILYKQMKAGFDSNNNSEMIYTFSLQQTLDGNKIFLANVTLYSSNQVIYERLKVGLAMLLFNAMIKSVALLILFYIAFRKYLEIPLDSLMRQISNLKEKEQQNHYIDVKFKQTNELSTLQNKFNALLKNIYTQEEQRIEMVQDQNKYLESLVQERTSELEIANKQLQELATTDALTQIANRSKLDEVINHSIAMNQRYNQLFSIVMIDIDYFKKVNDTYGHLTGDMILQEVSQLMKNRIRSVDTVGRWGGEEFMIIYQEIDCQGTYALADNIRNLVEHHTFKDVKHITISMGVAQFQPESSLEELLKQVDSALYYSKEHGRNQVTTYCNLES
jgi:diguanylate cyclase (GGDEF)-like protein